MSKNKKKGKDIGKGKGGDGDEDDAQREQRIRKEQMALEDMRMKVMRQYSLLREKRRGGGDA